MAKTTKANGSRLVKVPSDVRAKIVVEQSEVGIGERWILDAMTWLRSYVVITEGQALVAILWAIHTWIYERFPMTPYLQVSATTKQAGKTLFMEAVGSLCRAYQGLATIRTAAMVRMIEAFDGEITFGLDEAERLSSNALSDTRSMLTTGYRRGQMHPVSVGPKAVMMRVFAPRMFALIGDMVGVLRDRSIQMDLARAIPPRDFTGEYEEATEAANVLVTRLKDLILPNLGETTITTPVHLTGRDREIWTPLFSLASMLKLSARLTDLLIATSVDMSKAKTLPARANFSMKDENSAALRIASERIIPDLITVLGDKPFLLSTDACEGLKAIPAAPWRSYGKPTGLDQIALASLLRIHGLKAKSIQLPKSRDVARGFRRADLLELAAKLSGVNPPANQG